jgi:hypothetical protein
MAFSSEIIDEIFDEVEETVEEMFNELEIARYGIRKYLLRANIRYIVNQFNENNTKEGSR